ncbi:MAG: hypothetical protein RL701_2596, partial [Pseudomonadota bacterium]
PATLSVYAPDVPKALEELVRSLLSAERRDRPRTAAEVYERLTVIADLSRNEASGSEQAYLTRPNLIGRELELEEIAVLARHTARSSGARGSSLLLSGARGLGRTRLLDAAVLDAKLAGLRVARADASSSPSGALSTARALFQALLPELPSLAADLQAVGLNNTDDGDHSQEELQKALEPAARSHTLNELSRALLAASALAPLALVVDDIHAIDEPSRALLAILAAHAHEHALLIVSSIDTDAALPANSAVALLREYSQNIELAALDAAQTRELIVSIVGEVPNVDILSVISQRHCQGNPQRLLESLRSLIEQRLLRYEGGQWLISPAPEARAAMETALARDLDLGPRLLRLSVAARELLEVIAFDEDQILHLASYPLLLAHGDRDRMHQALSELLVTRWVELQEDRVRLARTTLGPLLTQPLSNERRRELHARFAEYCATSTLPAIYEAHHRLASDQPAAAIAALETFSAFVEQHPQAEIVRQPITLTVIEAASRMPDFAGAHPALRAKFMTATVLNTITYRGLPEVAAPRIGPALQLVAPFSGMADYRELANLSEPQRLHEALKRAAERCASPGLGALDLVSALRAQTRVCMAAGLAANFMADATLLDNVPDLTPFLPLSPALRSASQFVAAAWQLVRGQVWLAWDDLLAMDRELSVNAEQIDPLTHRALSGVALAYLSGLHADYGVVDAERVIAAYERYMPDHAESHRARFHMARGDISAAAAARRRFETLSVRMGTMNDARITALPAQLSFYALCDDSIGLRDTHVALQEVSKTRPGWHARAELARAHLLRCQGRAAEGLTVIERSLAQQQPNSVDWSHAAAAHVQLLNAAQHWQAAADSGMYYREQARAACVPEFRIELGLARACVELGQHSAAESYYANASRQLEGRRATGVLMGVVYELGAYLALRRNDAASFETRLAACAQEFHHGRHPALTARYNALQRNAASAQGALPDSRIITATAARTSSTLESQTTSTTHSR